MAQRIKGQDVSLALTVNGALKKSVTDIKDLEITSQLSILTEGYLGETSNRRDSIFNGVKGKITFHLEDPAILDVIREIVNAARSPVAGTVVTITSVLNFPSGPQRIVTIRNCFFGDIPLTFGGREQYGTSSLDFEAEDVIFA